MAMGPLWTAYGLGPAIYDVLWIPMDPPMDHCTPLWTTADDARMALELECPRGPNVGYGILGYEGYEGFDESYYGYYGY